MAGFWNSSWDAWKRCASDWTAATYWLGRYVQKPSLVRLKSGDNKPHKVALLGHRQVYRHGKSIAYAIVERDKLLSNNIKGGKYRILFGAIYISGNIKKVEININKRRKLFFVILLSNNITKNKMSIFIRLKERRAFVLLVIK